MKKTLSIILALAMALSMSVTAFAATNDGTSGTDITVNGTYTPRHGADGENLRGYCVGSDGLHLHRRIAGYMEPRHSRL